MVIETYLHEIALVLAILMTSLSQTLLRVGAREKMRRRDILFNTATITGYCLFFAVVLLIIFTMQKLEMKTVMAWNATTYVVTPLVSRLLIKEQLNRRIMTGSFVITIGLIIFVQ